MIRCSFYGNETRLVEWLGQTAKKTIDEKRLTICNNYSVPSVLHDNHSVP